MADAKLFLGGDLMLGRGVDQILRHSCPPLLHEPAVHSAEEYVALAESVSGPIPRCVDPRYIWGDALAVLRREHPSARIVNLETSLTLSEEWQPKGINYRAHPRNVDVLAAARMDCCILANNHVLDWGEAGMIDTIEALDAAGIAPAGAGRDAAEAAAPCVIPLHDRSRLLVFAFGAADSGVPIGWSAAAARAGINFLASFRDDEVRRIAASVGALKRPGDIAVASIHWGDNWGYEIPSHHRRFAHGLVDDAGIDLVYGHSAHHPKAIEVHSGRAILYGCGDLIDDYEGISGYEEFRDDLVLLYFASLDVRTGALIRLVMQPMRIRRFRLNYATAAEQEWLRVTLDRECRRFGQTVTPRNDGSLSLDGF